MYDAISLQRMRLVLRESSNNTHFYAIRLLNSTATVWQQSFDDSMLNVHLKRIFYRRTPL